MEKKTELLKSLRHSITTEHAASVLIPGKGSPRGAKCHLPKEAQHTESRSGQEARQKNDPNPPRQWLRAQSLPEESLQIFNHKTGAVLQLEE